MIFVTSENGKHLFTGFVNKIIEKPLQTGGVIKTYLIGTSECKNYKDVKENNAKAEYESSNWFFTLMGSARKKCDANPLKVGDRIGVLGFKQTNAAKKLEDGTWGKSFLNMSISDYELMQGNQASTSTVTEESSTDDELPF